MTEGNIDEVRKAAQVMDAYIKKYYNGGDSWWRAHTGEIYSGDVRYFLKMWEDILNALGLLVEEDYYGRSEDG